MIIKEKKASIINLTFDRVLNGTLKKLNRTIRNVQVCRMNTEFMYVVSLCHYRDFSCLLLDFIDEKKTKKNRPFDRH